MKEFKRVKGKMISVDFVEHTLTFRVDKPVAIMAEFYIVEVEEMDRMIKQRDELLDALYIDTKNSTTGGMMTQNTKLDIEGTKETDDTLYIKTSGSFAITPQNTKLDIEETND